jgi:hypothetical protein
MHSQSILKQEPRVTTIINSKGDSLIQFKLSDARLVLNDLLEKRISDSLIFHYEKLDKSRIFSYKLLESKLIVTESKLNNSDLMVTKLEKVVVNKDTEINSLNSTIKQQTKEIFKQKTLKIFGFSAAIILPITAILLIK